MVKLEKIEMNGFKSFLSVTEFSFGEGITAVVGPNGCGKSNIADAINWVIGERSSKSLRADQMGDVIFSGTDNRRPLGMAEVTLVLEDPRGTVPARVAGPGDGKEQESETTGGDTSSNGDGPEDIRAIAVADDGRIRITRRLFRSGESEYLIGGQKRRLKDIQELLAHLGVGTGVYSIIEQGKVDRVISTRPRDRRVLIEEAAGIALYKIRKRQAQSKLEATEANLARINDIVSEQERQINSLKRQAAKARRYARINEGIDRAERILFHHESVRLEALSVELKERRAEAEAGERRAGAGLKEAESRLNDAREAAARESRKHQEARDALHEMDREIDALKRSVERSREQQETASEQIRRAEGESAEIGRRLSEGAGRERDLSARVAAAAEHHAGLDASVESQAALGRLDAACLQSDESALASAREDLVAAAAAVSEARNEINRQEERRANLLAEVEKLARDSEGIAVESSELEARRSRHAGALQEAGARFEHARRESQAAAELLRREEERRERIVVEREQKRGLLEGIGERLATLKEVEESAQALVEDAEAWGGVGGEAPKLLKDLITPPPDLDRAVDAALRGLLRGFVTGSTEEAVSFLRDLKDKGRGRAVVIPRCPDGSDVSAAAPSPGALGTLAGLMGEDAAGVGALRPLLERVLVARDLDEALRLRDAGPGCTVVTLQGDLLAAEGWMEGGAELPEEAGVMTLKRLLERLAADAERTRLQIEELTRASASAGDRLALLRGKEADWRRRADELGREFESVRLRGETLQEEESRLRLKRDVQAGESQRAADELAMAREGLQEARRRLEAATRQQEEHQRLAESLTGATEAARVALATRQEELAGLREQAASARVARTALEAELRHHVGSLEELRRRLASCEEERAQWEARFQEAGRRIEAESERLSDRMADRILAEGAVASAAAAAEERRQGLESHEEEVARARSVLESARDGLHQVALDEERHAGDLRNLESRVSERGWASVALATSELTEEDRARERGEVETELAQWKEKRDRMGPVNLMAMEQFRELEERYEFITAQRRDLEESIRSLRETISRINRQSRERFLTAFESIKENFSELYKLLFRGGRADLKLVQEVEGEDDILEAGLEISAQPPGKRLQSISLLSGGEKALTALALLFAIFRHAPSPFCLLDEVDAALDELNVSRYVSLLKELSLETQFIVITHNRRTMEEANVLYGVTMEEPGVSRTVSVVMGSPEQRREAARSLPEQLASRHRGPARGPRAQAARGGALPDA